jgi:hypothetical protein
MQCYQQDKSINKNIMALRYNSNQLLLNKIGGGFLIVVIFIQDIQDISVNQDMKSFHVV